MRFISDNLILVKNMNDDISKIPRTIVRMMCKMMKHVVKAIDNPKFSHIPKEENKEAHIVAKVYAISGCNVWVNHNMKPNNTSSIKSNH